MIGTPRRSCLQTPLRNGGRLEIAEGATGREIPGRHRRDRGRRPRRGAVFSKGASLVRCWPQRTTEGPRPGIKQCIRANQKRGSRWNDSPAHHQSTRSLCDWRRFAGDQYYALLLANHGGVRVRSLMFRVPAKAKTAAYHLGHLH